MAITFLDPTRPATLPSRNEVLDFSVSSDPEALVVSLRYPGGHMETIYQAGATGVLYTVTRETNVFRVARLGGWPGGQFELLFTEADVAPDVVVPPTWHKIYELDFTTLVGSTFFFPTATGTFSLGGKTWYLKSAFSKTNMTPFLDPAVGLGWSIDFGEGSPIGDLDSVPSGVSTPHWWLPFSAIPEYDPAIPICIRFRPPDFKASTSDQGGFAVGITSHTNDTVVHSSADRKYDAFVIRPGGTGRISTASSFGNSGISAFQTGMNGKNGLALYSYPGLRGAHFIAGTDAASWTGFPADPSLMTEVSTGNTGYSGNKVTLPRPNPGLMLMSYGNGIPGSSVAIRNFEIWQYYSDV